MSSLIDWLLALCRADPISLRDGIEYDRQWFTRCLGVTLIGSGLYGATIGLWRSPLQGLYTGIKFPAVILITAGGNAMINGMLVQVLGLPITFRKTYASVITCFTISSAIMGSLAPVSLFFLLNTSALDSGKAMLGHNVLLLTHVVVITFAGIVGHAALSRLLQVWSGSRPLALRILLSWLGTNLFLGCQLSWSMRPFVGTPGLPVEFFRVDAVEGNFYESIYKVLRLLTS